MLRLRRESTHTSRKEMTPPMPGEQNFREGGREQQSDFMRLLFASEQRIRAYIRVLVMNRDEAEDIFQEVCVTLLEKYDPRHPKDDFTAWSCRVASFKVMELRQKHKRNRLRFSDETVRVLVDEAVGVVEEVNDRQEALRKCLAEILPANRQLIASRYMRHESIEAISSRLGRSVQAVYKVLSRVRKSLHDCIESRLSDQQEFSS